MRENTETPNRLERARLNRHPVRIIKELVEYDGTDIYWKARKPRHFNKDKTQTKRWNSRYAGRRALTSINSGGHRTGTVLGMNTTAPIIAMTLATGKYPKHNVKLVNNNKMDISRDNMVDVKRSIISRNAKVGHNHPTGERGVNSKNEVHLVIDEKEKCLGRYKNRGAATRAARRARVDRESNSDTNMKVFLGAKASFG